MNRGPFSGEITSNSVSIEEGQNLLKWFPRVFSDG